MLFYSLILLVGFILGVYVCARAADSLQKHDHPSIVWDEILGYLLTMYMIPISLWSVVIGFLLFRLFDILKPWPIRYLDRRVHGGFGIMLDDVIAALFANILLRLALPFLQ